MPCFALRESLNLLLRTRSSCIRSWGKNPISIPASTRVECPYTDSSLSALPDTTRATFALMRRSVHDFFGGLRSEQGSKGVCQVLCSTNPENVCGLRRFLGCMALGSNGCELSCGRGELGKRGS